MKNFSDRVSPLVHMYKRKTGKNITGNQLWGPVKSSVIEPKQADFLWRLIHGKILTGPKLHWLSRDKQRCPLDDEP